jgi:cbb3-type cytochrome oxidase subunit 3
MDYLGMDVTAMTANDWVGVFLSVAVFAGMVYVYFIVLRPGNKEKFESQRGMALDDDDPIKMGEKR